MATNKKPPRNVLKLIADAMKSKDRKAAKTAAKKPTLAQRFIPRKGHR